LFFFFVKNRQNKAKYVYFYYGFFADYLRTDTILSLMSPAGAAATTVSPEVWLRIASPIGDS
jgi:hypothetical protein